MEGKKIKDKIRKALEQSSYNLDNKAEANIDRLAEELSIYHIELLHQNEELERTQSELSESRAKYMDIFDHAPVGYVIYDFEGKIREFNSTFMKLAGLTDSSLINSSITQFIDSLSQDHFYFFTNRVKQSKDIQFCEVKLKNEEKDIYVSIYSSVEKRNGESLIRSAFIDISKQKEQQKEIEYLSFHDQLTGLFNRHFLNEEIERLNITRNYPISMIMIDVDGLKLVNDAFGHKVGDSILVRISDCLKKSLRGDEIISRWGGDEFLVILPNTSIKKTNSLIKRLDSKIKNELKEPIETSTSFGCAEINENKTSFEEAFSHAEKSMYKQKLFHLKSKRREIIEAIMAALHEKAPREEVHSRNVNSFSMEFGKILGLADDKLKILDLASLFHDIGKISIDYSILDKPTSLTKEEYEEIKHHPEAGYRILNMIPDCSDIADVVLHHHERFDGKGYPNGLSGKDIPYLDRIISIVDTFDAIISDRPYRKGQTVEMTVDILKQNRSKQFDPKLTDIFINEVIPIIRNKHI